MKIISFGGSILYDNNSNFRYNYLKRVKKILDDIDEKLIFVVGGGRLARELIKRASIIDNEESYLDRVGIFSTKINALMFSKIFDSRFIEFNSLKDDFSIIEDINSNVVLSGIVPGVTTDYDAVHIANELDVSKVYNFTDVDYWYYNLKTKEPIECITYEELEEEFDLDYKPGMNIPFDPKALNLARKHSISIYVMNGNKISKISDFVNNDDFTGTKILSN